MKKILSIFAITALVLTSCGDSKKETSTEVKKAETVETKVEAPKVVETKAADTDASFALGEKLFADKTCNACHQLDAKVIGPSIKDIAKVYVDKKGDLVKFLKGTDAAIVDTDPGQVAIMKANLDGFVKELSEDELQALAHYMNTVK